MIRFQVLKATYINMAVFWYIVPCSLIDTDRLFRSAASINRATFPPTIDTVGLKLLCNVSQYLPDYTAQHTRRQPYFKTACEIVRCDLLP
jgi:hypothetical protein